MKGDIDSDVFIDDANSSARSDSDSEAHFDSSTRNDGRGENGIAVLGHELLILQDHDENQDDYNNDENNSSGENQAAIIEPLSGPLSPQPCGLAVAKTGLVAEIFSGILCSEISCNHCNKVSRIKERCTFENQKSCDFSNCAPIIVIVIIVENKFFVTFILF